MNELRRTHCLHTLPFQSISMVLPADRRCPGSNMAACLTLYSSDDTGCAASGMEYAMDCLALSTLHIATKARGCCMVSAWAIFAKRHLDRTLQLVSIYHLFMNRRMVPACATYLLTFMPALARNTKRKRGI